MERDELIAELERLGRTLRLVAINMESGALTGNLLRVTFTSLRNTIDTLLSFIDDDDVLDLNTSLPPKMIDAIMEHMPDPPDYPPWS